MHHNVLFIQAYVVANKYLKIFVCNYIRYQVPSPVTGVADVANNKMDKNSHFIKGKQNNQNQ